MPTSTCFIQLAGGLGNQLFQIAAAFAYCKRNGYTMKISKNIHSGVRKNTYWDSFLHNLSMYVSTTHNSRSLWKEPHFHYCPIPPHAQLLDGYFQSSKYFNDAINEIRHLFVPHPRIITTVNEKYKGLVTPHSVAIHVRRGDYLNPSVHNYHFVTSPEYFDRSVTKIRELDLSAELVVFSDDIDWCREQSFFKGAKFIDESDECITLELMSRFQNYIISNSSFSWWAIQLGATARVVIAPNIWFGPRGPKDCDDIYEPSWIRVPV
jgi:hypothetical protein